MFSVSGLVGCQVNIRDLFCADGQWNKIISIVFTLTLCHDQAFREVLLQHYLVNLNECFIVNMKYQ